MLKHFEKLASKKEFDKLSAELESAYQKADDPTGFLITLLTVTDVPQLRNEVALILAEHPDERAIVPLIELIKSDRTTHNKSNLLTALSKYDYTQYCGILFDFLINGYFEVSRKSYLMLESIADNIPTNLKIEGIQKIKDKVDDHRGEICFLSEMLVILNDK